MRLHDRPRRPELHPHNQPQAPCRSRAAGGRSRPPETHLAARAARLLAEAHTAGAIRTTRRRNAQAAAVEVVGMSPLAVVVALAAAVRPAVSMWAVAAVHPAVSLATDGGD